MMASNEITGYRSAQILSVKGLIEDAVLLVNENGRILDVVMYRNDLDIEIIDFGEYIILPGLIDTHTHGAMGFDTMDAKHESLNEMSKFFASRGVVAFTPTTVTAPDEKTVEAIKQVQQSMQTGVDGAEILGSYLEGPFLTPENRGCHPEEMLQPATIEKLREWIEVSNKTIVSVALAPEQEGSESIIDFLKENHINTMIAHTNANYEQAKFALDRGATGVVHCYNGMTGLHHREPGVVGAALTHSKAYVELINDGQHVHKAATDIAYRCCGQDRLVLVTDSMQATGMPDGDYVLGETPVKVTNSVCRTVEGGLAGSTLTLDKAVFNLKEFLGLELVSAWKNASQIPAKMLRLDNVLGSLREGKKASFVVVNPNNNGEIIATYVNGKQVFSHVK